MKSSGIGGQAVLEGVMMKNHSKYAVAVRKPDGEIAIKVEERKEIGEKFLLFRLPVIRGVVAFVDSLVLGIGTLTYSSHFLEEAEAQEKKENQAGKASETLENVVIVLLSILLAIGFFFLLPFFLSNLLRDRITSNSTLSLIEGLLRIILFIAYVGVISMMKDIRRVFMYHGAEHKVINCVEHGMELNIENAKKQSCQHRRCGTSFLLLVMLLSVIFFLFITVDSLWMRILFRVLLIPVIAGVAYEIIRAVAGSRNRFIRILILPGLLLQRLTTREPEDDMLEVAIASVNAVFDWKTYQETCRKESQMRKKKRQELREKKAKEKSVRQPENQPVSQLENQPENMISSQSEDQTISQSDRSTEDQEVLTSTKAEILQPENKSSHKKKSRAQLRREIKEREEKYHQMSLERARRKKEQEEKEAQLEEDLKIASERIKALEEEGEDYLEDIDHFLDAVDLNPNTVKALEEEQKLHEESLSAQEEVEKKTETEASPATKETKPETSPAMKETKSEASSATKETKSEASSATKETKSETSPVNEKKSVQEKTQKQNLPQKTEHQKSKKRRRR